MGIEYSSLYLDETYRFHVVWAKSAGTIFRTQIPSPENFAEYTFSVFINGLELNEQDYKAYSWNDNGTYRVVIELLNGLQFNVDDFIVVWVRTRLDVNDVDFAEGQRLSAQKLKTIFVRILQKLEELKSAGFAFASPLVLMQLAKNVADIAPRLAAAAEADVDAYVDTVSKPEIDNYVNTVSKPAIDNYVDTVSKPEIDSYVDTVSKPEIDNYVDTSAKPEIDSYVDTSAKPKIDNHVETSAKPAIDNYLNTTVYPAIDAYWDNLANSTTLDADTLDGLHATDFVQQDSAGNVTINGSLDVGNNLSVQNLEVIKLFPPAIPKDSIAYFKKQLIDEIIGIKPDGYDGSTVTSYGLRTSSDNATLVVTERKDDVPFPGVTSFAVEEGTTNKHATEGQCAQDWTKWSHWGNRTCWSSESQYDDPVMGKVFVGINAHSDFAILYDYWPYSVEAGKTYTMSIYLKADQAWTGNLKLYVAKSDWTNIASIYQTATVTTTWKRFTATFTASMSATDVGFGWQLFGFPVGAKLYAALPQFEEKPFATSFVDGTRPKGRFHIPLDKLGFNPAADEWVIAYWKKPFGTHINGLTGYNIMAIGYYTADNSVGYIWWGKENNSNTFRVEVRYNNGTYEGAGSSTFDPNWYFNNWHFEVLKKTSDEIKYYVDGVLQCSLTLSYPPQTFTEGLYIGGYKHFPCNNLIANLLIARYDPATWTDEYIKFLYETQKPFFV
jgi:hypothetical protein